MIPAIDNIIRQAQECILIRSHNNTHAVKTCSELSITSCPLAVGAYVGHSVGSVDDTSSVSLSFFASTEWAKAAANNNMAK